MAGLEELVELDHDTAKAVQVVLRRAGISSEVRPSGDEWVVLVQGEIRDDALQVMANRMEEVITVRDHKPAPKRMSAGTAAYLAEEPKKPLFTTRLKNMTVYVLLLFIPAALTLGMQGAVDDRMIAIIWGVTLIIAGVWYMWARKNPTD